MALSSYFDTLRWTKVLGAMQERSMSSSTVAQRPGPISMLCRLLLATAVLWFGAADSVAAADGSGSAREDPQLTREFDVLILGGRIVDGTGTPPYRGDVGVIGDTIVALGNLSTGRAKQVVQAAGKMVTPG